MTAAKEFSIKIAVLEFAPLLNSFNPAPTLVIPKDPCNSPQVREEVLEKIAFSCFFTHPVKFAFAFSLVLIAAALQRSHVTVLWSSGVVVAATTMYLHSDEDIPISSS